MNNILSIILNVCQPLAIVIFVVSGVCSFALGLKQQGAVNLSIAVVNLFIFYGDKILK